MASYRDQFENALSEAASHINAAKSAYRNGRDYDEVEELLKLSRKALNNASKINIQTKG